MHWNFEICDYMKLIKRGHTPKLKVSDSKMHEGNKIFVKIAPIESKITLRTLFRQFAENMLGVVNNITRLAGSVSTVPANRRPKRRCGDRRN